MEINHSNWCNTKYLFERNENLKNILIIVYNGDKNNYNDKSFNNDNKINKENFRNKLIYLDSIFIHPPEFTQLLVIMYLDIIDFIYVPGVMQ